MKNEIMKYQFKYYLYLNYDLFKLFFIRLDFYISTIDYNIYY